MIKVGIIGIGNCGGQIASLAAQELGIDAVAINTSDTDLEKVKGDSVSTFLIGDNVKGAGQNRTDAKEALEKSIQEVLDADNLKKFIDNQEMIFVAGSTGGGTGSGLAPLLTQIVSNSTTVPVILIGVLPTLNEPKGVQENTLSYLDEVDSILEDAHYILHDNNKYSGTDSIKRMRTINSDVVQDIRILSCYYNAATEYDSIDEQDMTVLLGPAGRIVTASVQGIGEKDLDTTSIEEMIVHQLKTNTHVELDRDKSVVNTGLITKLSPTLNRTLDMNIPQVYEFIGNASGTGFRHISINDETGMPNEVYFIATGLSAINDRINKINERIDEIDNSFVQANKATAIDKSKLRVQQPTSGKKVKPMDVTAIFDKFRTDNKATE